MTEHQERRKYTREFKREAVQLYESSRKSMRVIEQELGFTPSSGDMAATKVKAVAASQ